MAKPGRGATLQASKVMRSKQYRLAGPIGRSLQHHPPEWSSAGSGQVAATIAACPSRASTTRALFVHMSHHVPSLLASACEGRGASKEK